MLNHDGEKFCRVCNRWKSVKRFPQEDGYRDGIGRHQCQACRAAYRRALYHRQKEAKRAAR